MFRIASAAIAAAVLIAAPAIAPGASSKLLNLGGQSANAGIVERIQKKLAPADQKILSGQTPRQVDPLISNLYDGADRQKLAESSRGPLGEEDLLLYLLVKNNLQPAIYDDYMNETDPLRKKALAEQLRDDIKDFYYTQAFATMDQGPDLTDFEQIKVQTMTLPAVEFVWLDRVVRPGIEATPGEMRLYYRSHAKEFITPHRVHVRYIFRPLDPSLSRREVDDEEKLMDSLREVMSQHPEKFAEAAREYSKAPSASNGGEIPSFAEGEMFPDFEKNAFSLNLPGEVGQVFRNNQGLFLVQLIEHIMPKAMGYEDAQLLVKKAVLKQEITQKARYEIDQMRKSAHIEARFEFWNDLNDDDMIVRMGKTTLTKAQFWKLYPSVIDFLGNVSQPDLAYYSQRYVQGQLMLANLKKRGMTDDPRLARAQQMAGQIVHAQHVEKRRLEEKLPSSISGSGESEVLPAEIAAAPSSMLPLMSSSAPAASQPLVSGSSRMHVFIVKGEIENPREYDATTLMALRALLPRRMQTYIQQQAQQRPAASAPAERLGKTPDAVRNILKLSDEKITFSWQDGGWVNPSLSPKMQATLAGIREGQFSPVQSRENAATSYYVADESSLSPEEKEQLDLRVRRAHAQRQRERAIQQMRDSIAQSLDVRFVF